MLQCLVLESVIHWGGVVDELDFAQRLKSWSQHGLQDLDYDTEGYCVSDTTAKVTGCLLANCAPQCPY